MVHTKSRQFIPVLALVFFLAFAPVMSFARDSEATGRQPSDTLKIQVGYAGGPFYDKHEFTLSEIQSLPQVKQDYTLIDNMPSVVIDHVQGVRLADILEAAGIDLGSVSRFNFWTTDKSSDYFTSFTKAELIDRIRYCYYSLPDNFDYDEGKGNEYADSQKEPVDTVMAIADDWNRAIAGAEFGSDFMDLDTSTRYRLMFGQTNTYERTASRSAWCVHTIVAELGGAPVITLSETNLEGEVGSVLRTSASIEAADPVIAQGMEITWSSSDESVASVDSEGNVTVHGEGSAVITASAGGASASVTVNGKPESEEAEPEEAAVGLPYDELVTGQRPAGLADDGADEAMHYEIIKTPLEESESDETDSSGGVQNWRVYEMSETAEPLAEAAEENPLIPVMGGGIAGLFAAAFVLRIVRFRLQIKDVT